MPAHPVPIRIIWPPPGLESSQGILWKKARVLALGGALLVLPFLAGIAFPQPFNSLGLFGGAWWVRSLVSLVGVLVVTGALGGLVAFFLRARHAAKNGIDLETILQVGADNNGDMGALIQGTRCFRSLAESRRALAVSARIWGSLLYLSAATWITVGWVLSLILAGRGLVGPTGVMAITLAPAAVSFLVGLIARGLEGTVVREVLGPFFWYRQRNPGQTDAAKVWGEGIRELRANRGETSTPGARVSLAGALSLSALTFLVFIPTVGLTVASSVGPVLAAVAVPRFSATERKAGEIEAYRHLRLSPHPGIAPSEAGEALHSIVSVGGRTSTSQMIKAPVRTYDEPFLPAGRENPTGIQPGKWSAELFPTVVNGIGIEAESYLREVANHPGLAEFETLARAQAIDVLGSRVLLPLPAETSAFDIPIPRISALREGSYALVARAVVEFLDGDVERAEATLRTSLSAGFLILEEAPTLIDGLVGTVLAANAGDALEGLYRAAGRHVEAEALVRLRESTHRAVEAVQKGSTDLRAGAALAGMPARVTAPGTVRGVRWEYLNTLAGLGPCLNPNQVVFGPNRSSTDFLQSARSGLVRYPAEEAVFQVMERGWFTMPARGGLERALTGTVRAFLGDGPARCVEVLDAGIF